MTRYLAPLVRDLRTVVMTLVVATVCFSAPVVAAQLKNADTVDGKSAVGAGATTGKRAGKLVATDTSGRLPNNIIKKAPDSALLAGRSPASYASAVAAVGSVQTGVYGAWGAGAGYMADTINFVQKLPFPISSGRTRFIATGGETAECPGAGQVVPRGFLCVYEVARGNSTFTDIYNPAAAGYSVPIEGFGIYWTVTAGGSYSYGSWAIRAGDASTSQKGSAPERPAPRG